MAGERYSGVGTHNAADPRLQQLDEAERLVRQQMEAVRAARSPQAWGAARQTVQSFQAKALDFPKVFAKAGDFFRAVKMVANQHGGDWRQLAAMRDYVEKSASWEADYLKKSVGVITKASPSGLGETVGQDGGFLVPPQFVQQLLQRVYDNDLLSRCTLFPMTSNTMWIPAINETSRANGSRFGGVEATWEGEAQSTDNTKPRFHRVQLNLSKLMLTVRATDELLEDSGVALETFIENVASQEITFKVGEAIVRGNGVQKPEGILSAQSLISVPKEPGQAADTIVTENIVKMWARLFAPCRANSVWLINQEAEPQLYTMSLGVGTGGVATYMPPGGLSASPFGTLMGRPVLPVEFCSALGDQGDIILADLSCMLAGTRGGMQSAVSMHVYFTTAEQAFRFIMRLDARSWWTSALTKYLGNDTVSPFVTLDARA